jgi:predicted dinucleotide-binding enzyme
MMPVASDDAQAKATAMKLAEVLGFEAIDARPLEPLALFWIKQACAQKFGPTFAFSLIRQ